MHAMGIRSDNRKAVVFCEGLLGETGGKTANGLVRSSSYFDICGVIDSRWHGYTADKVIDGGKPIPVVGSLAEAVQNERDLGWFIYGKETKGGVLPDSERIYIKDALARKLRVASGLMHFLSDDEDFRGHGDGSAIVDIRKPPSLDQQHIFSGRVETVGAKRILVAGTDCAQGKRTTADLLYHALKDADISCAMIATGQTGIMQGFSYGVCPDAWSVVCATGAIEQVILQCWEEQRPDVILIEGQSSASHPALLGGITILKGSRPHAVVMQDTPGRKIRVDFPEFAKPDIRYEIALLKKYANVEPIAITLNPESLDEPKFQAVREDLHDEYDVPVVNPMVDGVDELVDAVRQTL